MKDEVITVKVQPLRCKAVHFSSEDTDAKARCDLCIGRVSLCLCLSLPDCKDKNGYLYFEEAFT